MFGVLLSWLTSGPLDRIFSTIDRKIAADTDREKLKSDLAAEYVRAQAQVLTGRGWWFPVLFLVPAGLHFAAVSIYSILFCRGCAFPVDWTIAALPPPFAEWQGVMVTSLFVGKAGEALIGRLRR